MQAEIENFKKRIELIYDAPEQQSKKTGFITGNYYFTENQLSKIREFKAEREKIYDELARLPLELFRQVAYTIEQGFLYIWDDKNSIREQQRLYRKPRLRIQRQIDKLVALVDKTNEELQNEDSYFKKFPITINVQIPYHHLDNPHSTRSGRPKEARINLIKELSDLLKPQMPEEADRSKFISEILHFFYDVPDSEADPRTVRMAF